MKATTLAIAFAAALHFNAAAQTDTLRHNTYYCFSVGNTVSRIKNETIDGDSHLDIRSQRELRVENSFAFKIANGLRLLVGLNYEQFSEFSVNKSTYQQALSVDKYYYYYYPLYIADYTLLRRVSILSLPVGLQVNPGRADKVRFLLEFGLQPGFPVSSKEKYDGHYSYEGLYPTTSGPSTYILVKDDSDLGYYENKSYDKGGELGTKGLVFSFFGNLGFTAPVSKQVELAFKGSYISSLSDVTKSSDEASAYYDITGARKTYSKTKVSAIGVNIGLRVALQPTTGAAH